MPGYGFPRKLRLTKAAEYQSVFKEATFKVSSPHVLVLARYNNLDHARLGLVVGRKAIPRAVQRNRLKRLVRNAFRLNQDLLSGLDIVILARNSGAGLDNQAVTQDLASLWRDLIKKSAATRQRSHQSGP